MSNNIIIDLIEIFSELNTKSYSLIKLSPNFPKYSKGDDIDIFCLNIDDIKNIILKYLNKYVSKNRSIKISKLNNQMHIDLLESNVIYFRFDLYGNIPKFINVKLKDSFFSTVLENSKIININDIQVKVPSDIDELIIRYIEYHEYYAQRPDKVKHINYINDKIAQQQIDKELFLDKIHYYTYVPDATENRIISNNIFKRNLSTIIYIIKKVFLHIKEKGILSLIKRVIGKK